MVLKHADKSPEIFAVAPALAGKRSANTPERIAKVVVRGILMRRYLPGQRLTEAELTHELEVSRGTIREALRILDASGVVELTPNRGAVIRSLSARDSQELVEVTEVLAGLAARLAARNIDIADHRKRFEAVAETLRAPHAPRQLASILEERRDFYGVMFAIAGNGELDRAFPLARAQLFRTQFRRYLTPSDLRAMIREYRAVAEAILDGDERRAEQRMRRHMQRTAERTIPRLAGLGGATGAHDGR